MPGRKVKVLGCDGHDSTKKKSLAGVSTLQGKKKIIFSESFILCLSESFVIKSKKENKEKDDNNVGDKNPPPACTH